MDPDDPARVSVPHGGDGGDDDAPPDETEVSDATVSDATVPDDVEPFPDGPDDALGLLVRRPADDDAITSDATPAGRDSSSPVMNATSALPTDPGEGSPDSGVTRGDAEPEAAATPAATRERGALEQKGVYTNERDERCGEDAQDGAVDEDIVETADAPTAPPRNATTTPNAVSSSEDPTDDAASLSDAPRLPEADLSDPSDEPDEADQRGLAQWTPTLSSARGDRRSARRLRPRVSRVGVNTTVTDPKTVNGGRLAPPKPGERTPG